MTLKSSQEMWDFCGNLRVVQTRWESQRRCQRKSRALFSRPRTPVKSFLPFLFNDITWKTSLLKTKTKWREMTMSHLTQKGVLFSGFLMILQSETKTDWTLTRSLMFFSVDTMEDHKGGGCRPRGNFLRGGGEGRPSREIPSYTLLHILAEHDHVDQNMR